MTSKSADVAEAPIAIELGSEELNLVRQWFNAYEDLAPDALEKADYDLMEKIAMVAGFPFKRRK